AGAQPEHSTANTFRKPAKILRPAKGGLLFAYLKMLLPSSLTNRLHRLLIILCGSKFFCPPVLHIKAIGCRQLFCQIQALLLKRLQVLIAVGAQGGPNRGLSR